MTPSLHVSREKAGLHAAHGRGASALALGAAFFGALVVAGCGTESTDCNCGRGPSSVRPEAGENLPGGTATNTLLFGKKAFTLVVPNATSEHKSLFYAGNSFFNSSWVQAPSSTSSRDGLGPLFNARSCSGCHFEDGRGRPPLEPDELMSSMLLRVGTGGLGEHGEPEGDPAYGDQLQPNAIADIPAEGTPRIAYHSIAGTYADGEAYELLSPTYSIEAAAYGPLPDGLRISPRVAPQMIGLGLLEAIPEERLLGRADPDDADGDGISGRANRVWDRTLGDYAMGRFGWKAEQPSVEQQSAGAFDGDIGITSDLFPSESCTGAEAECAEAVSGGSPEASSDVMAAVGTYARLLAVPQRGGWDDPSVLAGKALFTQVGCDGCHTPRQQTGQDALEELVDQVIWPYTDLLLHDLGPGLSDDRPSFDADGCEWRTPPLWGIGRIPEVNGHDRLLHDGRARGVAEAILWHEGEAVDARERFRALTADERAKLVQFVESL